MNFYLSSSWLAESKKKLLESKEFSVQVLATNEAPILVLDQLYKMPDPVDCDSQTCGAITCNVEDDDERHKALIHERNYNRFAKPDEEPSRSSFTNGTVILLTAYSYGFYLKNRSLLLTPSQAEKEGYYVTEETDDIEFLLLLEEFECIGHMDLSKTKSDTAVCHTIASVKSTATHTLVNLTPAIKHYYNWSVKCLLVNMSEVKTFVHQKTQKENKFMRLQWRDPSGSLEMAVFGSHCDRQEIQDLKLNHVYLIQHATIREANVKNRLWKDDFSLTVELMYIETTTITLVGDEDPDEYLAAREAEVFSPQPAKKRQRTDSSSDTDSPTTGLKLMSLANLKFHAAKTLHNVLVILLDFEDVEKVTPKSRKVDKPPLSVRRLRFIDDSGSSPIKVSLWGYQADTFNKRKDEKFQRGSIILFSKVELSNYLWVSLSVTQVSSYVKICEASDSTPVDSIAVSKINALKNWWSENHNKFSKDLLSYLNKDN